MTGTVFDPPAAQPAPALLDRSGRWGLVPQADHAGHAGGCCAVAACPAAGAGSRRRRLWDLDPHAHCPVVGLCLPVATLRRLMERHLASAPADDYELHGTGVGTCRTRNVFAEAVQRELDQRHAPQLRATRGLKTTAQLLAWWDLQRAGPHMAGALWAVLTHARCSSEAEDQVLGQVHMQQHEVGQMARALADRQQQLQAQLAQARRDQDQMAGRLDELRRQHAQERERLLAENLRLRGVVLAREALISQLDAERAALLQAQPDLPARQALAQQLRDQGERLRDLQRTLNRVIDDNTRLRAVRNEGAAVGGEGTAAPCEPPPAAPALNSCAVLCVGGRTGAVPVYRQVVEAAGAQFLHHDGGDENNLQRLDSTLAAADLVICQTGCVSHGAYWRVKDHCRRTGKRCVFVEQPSASSLQRALQSLAATVQDPDTPDPSPPWTPG
jgi:hypothetical protein